MGTETHSKLGASSSHRWLACPKSPAVSALCPNASSIYAKTGTAAHWVAEICLRNDEPASGYIGDTFHIEGTNIPIDKKMTDNVQLYLNEVQSALETYGGKLVIEQKFDLNWVKPGMYGRNDAAIIPDMADPMSDRTLRIFDYKNGVANVSADGNAQLLYYALGALGEGNPMGVTHVQVTIVQPNAWEKDESGVESVTYTVEEVYDWCEKVLRPGAYRTEDPEAPFVEGPHCKDCGGLAVCPAKRGSAVQLIKADTIPAPFPNVEILTAEEVGKASAYFNSPMFKKWCEALAERELEMLESGVLIPGRRLIEKKSLSNRAWGDEAKAVEALKSLGLCEDDLFTRNIVSPAQMEAVIRNAVPGMKAKEASGFVCDLTVRAEAVKKRVVNDGEQSDAAHTARIKQAKELFQQPE